MQSVTEQLHLKTGTWLAANCGEMPSEADCQMVMLAPADQRDELVDAAVEHAVTWHGHLDSPQLRREIDTNLEAVEI